MSIIAALARAYERLDDAPPFGYSLQKIGFVISLHPDGRVANVADLREKTGRKPEPGIMTVPQPPKRASGIAPVFLWDKTSYVLGITAGEGRRTADEHTTFVKMHLNALSDATDEGLVALRSFLTAWTPDQFVPPLWPDDMKDQNVIFALETQRLQEIYLHDRPAAKALWATQIEDASGDSGLCLASGRRGAVARLHPAIKGVWGAQSSGASIVSFNSDAYESYGHTQGDNAPVSERTAFAYTTALNHFLARGSSHRMQVGDASTVFWADARDGDTAEKAVNVFASAFQDSAEKNGKDDDATGATTDDGMQAKKVGSTLQQIRSGQPLSVAAPDLAEGVRFYILGLAPNAARLSVRFWLDDSFGNLVANYQRFVEDMRIDPPPRDGYPPLWRYLLETATLGKRENVSPNLAGDWIRAILTGQRYPQTLFSALRTRIRADGRINELRAGMLKAILIRNFNRKETPVALDPDFNDKGYLLGRLFAVYERIQEGALGKNVNATIKDKFYSSASAQPRKVFPMIDRNSANHLSKLGKQSMSQKVHLEKEMSSITEQMSPGDDPFPSALSAEEQALFGLGYYHQRSDFFKRKDSKAPSDEETT